MKNAHTPGPWIAHANKAHWIIKQGKSRRTIATISNAHVEQMGDAHLIAAAPSLKDAAHLALQALRHAPLEGPYGKDAKRALEVALAQAEGTKL